jgi:hypothetical protein
VSNCELNVPLVTKNLLSVSQIARDNAVYFEFHPNVYFVKSEGSNEILLKGILDQDGLYKFPSLLPKSSTNASLPDVSSSSNNSHFPTVKSTVVKKRSFASWHCNISQQSFISKF